MTKTITAVFDSPEQVKNAFEDLIATGIPQEKIYAEKDRPELKVSTPDTSAPEITEILRRHRPRDIIEKPLPGG